MYKITYLDEVWEAEPSPHLIGFSGISSSGELVKPTQRRIKFSCISDPKKEPITAYAACQTELTKDNLQKIFEDAINREER